MNISSWEKKVEIVYQAYNPLVSNSNSPEIKTFLQRNSTERPDTSNNSHGHSDLSVSPIIFSVFKTVFKSSPRTASNHVHSGVLLTQLILLIFSRDGCLTQLIDLLVSEPHPETVTHLWLFSWSSRSLRLTDKASVQNNKLSGPQRNIGRSLPCTPSRVIQPDSQLNILSVCLINNFYVFTLMQCNKCTHSTVSSFTTSLWRSCKDFMILSNLLYTLLHLLLAHSHPQPQDGGGGGDLVTGDWRCEIWQCLSCFSQLVAAPVSYRNGSEDLRFTLIERLPSRPSSNYICLLSSSTIELW